MTSPTPLLSTLESYLKLTTSREQAISGNMANIDTPGYHTRDIDFNGELNKAMSGVLNQSEDGAGPVQFSPVVREVSGLMSETQLQYQIGVQLVKHQFHQILSAISGGS